MRFIMVWGIMVFKACVFIGLFPFFITKQSIQEKEPDFNLSAERLYQAFESNENNANAVYLNQIIQVTGHLTDYQILENGKVLLMLKTKSPLNDVRCTLQRNQTNNYELELLKDRGQITVKGICIGMLMDVMLEDGVLVMTP